MFLVAVIVFDIYIEGFCGIRIIWFFYSSFQYHIFLQNFCMVATFSDLEIRKQRTYAIIALFSVPSHFRRSLARS